MCVVVNFSCDHPCPMLAENIGPAREINKRHIVIIKLVTLLRTAYRNGPLRAVLFYVPYEACPTGITVQSDICRGIENSEITQHTPGDKTRPRGSRVFDVDTCGNIPYQSHIWLNYGTHNSWGLCIHFLFEYNRVIDIAICDIHI